MRVIAPEEYCHDRLGDRFATALSDYDTGRRLAVLVDEFLGKRLRGKEILDVGCGLGFFSKRVKDYGGRITACDLGEGLVRRTRELVGCEAVVADCLRLTDYFGEERFDAVVSSECIEHTPDPSMAIRQMIRVLKPGGLLSLSTPNVVWLPVVKLATMLRLRPFDGLENFSSWSGIRRMLRSAGVEILKEKGLHLFPFQLPAHRLSRWCDHHMQWCRRLMINICVLARKPGRSQIL